MKFDKFLKCFFYEFHLVSYLTTFFKVFNRTVHCTYYSKEIHIVIHALKSYTIADSTNIQADT